MTRISSKTLLYPLAPLICRRARCVFVLSTGRCGTTTLTSLLALSQQIRSKHEPSPLFTKETKDAYQRPPASQAESWKVLKPYAHARLRPLLAAAFGGRVYAECSNRLTYFAPLLAERFPRAKFIHLFRHPADVVRSGMRRAYYTGRHRWDEFRIVPRPDDPYADKWPTWGPFEKCCWYWHAINEFSMRLIEQLPPGRGLAVSAESLFFDHGQTAHRIFQWLNLPSPSQPQLAEVLRAPENAQQQGNFPKWADWTHEQQSTLRAIAGDTASRLGYGSLLAPPLSTLRRAG